MKAGLNLQQFRDLSANTMNRLVRIPGIVISASVLSARATKLHLQCRACRSPKIVYPPSGLGGLGGGSDRGLPRRCDAPEIENQKKDCPMDPYLIVHSKSTFSDHQTLKLQEAPDMVPVGELPRHMLLSADRYLTGQVVPGSRVIATGIYSTFQSAKSVRLVFVRPRSIISRLARSHKSREVLQRCEIPTFVLCTWKCHLQLRRDRAAQIRSAYNFLLRKRRNSAIWQEAMASMNVSRKVLPLVFLGV